MGRWARRPAYERRFPEAPTELFAAGGRGGRRARATADQRHETKFTGSNLHQVEFTARPPVGRRPPGPRRRAAPGAYHPAARPVRDPPRAPGLETLASNEG